MLMSMQVGVVDFLMDQAADPTARDSVGRDSMDIAMEMQDLWIRCLRRCKRYPEPREHGLPRVLLHHPKPTFAALQPYVE